MDLVSFYDRTSGFQFAACAGLALLALMGLALIAERTIKFSCAGRQSRLFMRLASGVLADAQPSEALRLAAGFHSSPLAFVVNASVTLSRSGELQYSAAVRQAALTQKTAEVVRGLATLGAIAMTSPIIGAAAAVEGLIRCLRTSALLPISQDVLQNWISDWLLLLLSGLLVGFISTWAHRLLSAKANRLLLEMERLSLAIVCRVLTAAERPSASERGVGRKTLEIEAVYTTPIDIRSGFRHHSAP